MKKNILLISTIISIVFIFSLSLTNGTLVYQQDWKIEPYLERIDDSSFINFELLALINN